jgi:Subtilase family/Secretion system C-terminal sorting domain
MKRISFLFVLLMISCMVAPQILSAQSSYYQVTVYFISGVQRVVGPGDTAATVTSQNVLNVLTKYSLTSSNVYPAYPAFNEVDTLKTIDSAGDKLKQMDRAKVFVVTVTDTTTQNNLINDLKALSEVLFAEENGNNKNYIVPNDPGFANQWGLNNTANPGHDIHAEKAWDIFTGNPNSIIGIIDDGVDITHPDLSAKIVGGDHSFSITGSGLGAFSHGTLIAGIAAASTNNGIGIAGVDWQAKLLPEDKTDYWNCFCFNYLTRQHGDALVSQKIYQAIEFSPNVWTLNNSYGLVFKSGADGRYSTLVRAAFAYAYNYNRVSCAAVGNALPNSNVFPAGFNTGMLAVGESDNGDNPFGSTVATFVDVVAPGQSIYSTNFNNSYTTQQGSSLSTPFVSGLASLLKGYKVNLLNDDIINIIELSADYTGSTPPRDAALGFGRINAQKALQFLQAPYVLQHLTSTGGTTYATSGNIKLGMLGVMRLADAWYVAKRIEVRTTINLPTNYCTNIALWGTGIGTTGYRDDGGICYGEGFCQVVPGTQTSTQATLRTYVYQLYDILGNSLGYYPTSPAQVKFAYTILGVPQPGISGDNTVCTTTSNPYTLSNLSGIASVAWSATPSGVAQINSPSSNSTTLTKLAQGTINLSALVTNGCGVNQNFTASKTVAIGGPVVGITYSPSGTCHGSVQTWSLASNPSSNGSNWNWTVGVLGNNSSIHIYSPTSPTTLADVTGGGTVNLSYTDLCGLREQNGVTLFSSCHAAAVISPNPSSGMVTVSTEAGSRETVATTAMGQEAVKSNAVVDPSWKIYRIQVLGQNGNLVKLFNYPSGISSSTINLSDLKSGTYSLRIYDNSSWIVQQVVILK